MSILLHNFSVISWFAYCFIGNEILINAYAFFIFPTGQNCGNTFTAPTGTLTSENYPSSYPINSDCSNVISVPGATSILIQFNDFEVEAGFDYLYYGLGNTPDVNAALDRLSGIILPDDLTLQSGTVWFLFKSDISVNGLGYSLNWTAQVDPGFGGIVQLVEGCICKYLTNSAFKNSTFLDPLCMFIVICTLLSLVFIDWVQRVEKKFTSLLLIDSIHTAPISKTIKREASGWPFCSPKDMLSKNKVL